MNIWDYLPFIVIAAFLAVVILMYGLSYLARFFAYLKMKEDENLTHRILDSIHAYMKVIIIGMLIFVVVIASELLPGDVKENFDFLRDYVFAFNAFVAFFAFAVLSKLGSRAAANYRAKAEKDEKAMFRPGIMEFNELLIKYGMYVLGFIVATIVAIVTLRDTSTRREIIDFLGLDDLDTAMLGTEILSLFIILLILFIIGKFVSIILEDFKLRSKKFQPGLVDLIKAAVRYSLYWIAFVMTLTIILEIVGFEQLEILIWFIVALTLVVVVIVGLSPAAKNAISGIVLLSTDSINVGDWVQIGDGNTGEVLSQGLTMTSLKTRTGDMIDLPNEMILGSKIHNYTKLGGTLVRLALTLGADAQQDVVEKHLLAVASGLDESTNGVNPSKLTMISLEKGSMEYVIDIWRKDPASTELAISEFLKRFQKVASSNGISVLGTRLLS